MAERLSREIVADKAIVHPEAAVRAPTAVDRSFELPTALFLGTAGCYLAFMAVMAVGFASPELVLPIAIIVTFLGMAFGVPAMWMRMKPDHAQSLTSWGRFSRHGIMTAFGRSSAGAASVQVLILPVLILVWGFAVVTIAALVR
ncbi:MAG TPA: hypothetical protein VFS49_10805 [Croceibacterium sp.]|nr:hypothetical protein [Croceibacterium sp.]